MSWRSSSGMSANWRSTTARELGHVVAGCGKSVDHKMFSMPTMCRMLETNFVVHEGERHVALEVLAGLQAQTGQVVGTIHLAVELGQESGHPIEAWLDEARS